VATMRDVARRAGVSPMTVSNVVNGHENVRPETRARVLAAITELGYRMNTAARGLRRGRSGIIAIAVSTVASPYEGMISAALAEQVARAGYDPVIELTGHRRAGELDAFEVGEEIFQYSRAAKELWKACSSLARSGWTAPPGATWR